MNRFFPRSLALGFGLLLLSGCGRSNLPADVREISGRLAVGNAPLADVLVQFWLKEDLAQPGSKEVHGCAQTGPDGEFLLAPLESKPWTTGTYVVSVFDPQQLAQRKQGSKAPPRRYARVYATNATSPLEVQIQPGPNDLGTIAIGPNE